MLRDCFALGLAGRQRRAHRSGCRLFQAVIEVTGPGRDLADVLVQSLHREVTNKMCVAGVEDDRAFLAQRIVAGQFDDAEPG